MGGLKAPSFMFEKPDETGEELEMWIFGESQRMPLLQISQSAT
jgi:hypothetical protein